MSRDQVAALFPRASKSTLDANSSPQPPAVDEPRRSLGEGGSAKSRMNKTEENFGRILEAEKQRGDILEYAFEPFSLRYGQDAFYKPDWVARVNGPTTLADLTTLCTLHIIDIHADPVLLSHYQSLVDSVVFKHFRIIEVKGGHIFPEAKPRFKAAQLRHAWANWEMWQRKKGEWTRIL